MSSRRTSASTWRRRWSCAGACRTRPTAQPVDASANATPRRSSVVPDVCAAHEAPPLLVATIVPPQPTAQPCRPSTNVTRVEPLRGARRLLGPARRRRRDGADRERGVRGVLALGRDHADRRVGRCGTGHRPCVAAVVRRPGGERLVPRRAAVATQADGRRAGARPGPGDGVLAADLPVLAAVRRRDDRRLAAARSAGRTP